MMVVLPRRITVTFLLLAASVSLSSCEGFLLVNQDASQRTPTTRVQRATPQHYVLPQLHVRAQPTTSLLHNSNEGDTEQSFPNDLIGPLDLLPLVRGIADHAGTRRGRQALLALVGQDIDPLAAALASSVPARRRRVVTQQYRNSKGSPKRHSNLVSIAACVEDARREYELVEQAMLALNTANCGETEALTYPPLYGANSFPDDISACPESDDDEWMWLPVDELSLEHVLQAEQVVITLLEVKQWAQLSTTTTWLPGLSDIGGGIAEEELLSVLEEIGNAVEIVRVRSVTDPTGRNTFLFRLKEEMFPNLHKLRSKEQELIDTIDQEMKSIIRKTKGSPEYIDYDGRKVMLIPKSAATSVVGLVRGSEEGRCYVEPRSVVQWGDELTAVRRKLEAMEGQVESTLIQAILGAQRVIDASLQVMARLDVIFSRAAFGKRMKGAVPKIGNDGCISIKGFIHPVLALEDIESVMTTDLHLADNDVNKQNNRALVISGPNGGGKSVAMKSFGLACLLIKIGVPIPHYSEETPQVDFFQQVLVELGDQQNVIEGESTFMAKLNACSSLIQRVQAEKDSDSHSVILLDELGSGTDPTAGGAIGQAIMESILQNDECRIVATTHSPRLKALSFDNERFECATVLLKRGDGDYKLPTYQLQYGLIGDSYALGAASRSDPPLPDDVITRAASLLATNDSDDSGGKMLQALTNSLERQIDEASQARQQAEDVRDEVTGCREVMVTMARAYETKFSDIEERLESIVQSLKDDDSDSLEILGETLASLRVAKKRAKSDFELLREQGLKPVSSRYELMSGERVVITAKGSWEGTSATVVECEGSDTFLVIPESNWGSPMFKSDSPSQIGAEKPMLFQRHELAVWDYDSIWDEGQDASATYSRTVTVRESKQRLGELLSSMGTPKQGTSQSSASSKTSSSQFSSSRERKANNKKKRRKGK